MTAVADAPAAVLDTSVWAIGAPRLLAGLDRAPRLDLAGHAAVHGPQPGSDLEKILALLDAAAIAGRGGAGFPLAAKLRALPRGRARTVVVNGAESEPASRKDRVLLRRSPHLVLDGATALADATGARAITVAVHDDRTADSVRAAAAERHGHRVTVHVVDGGFVSGEARAVLQSIKGRRALPTGRRTPPTEHGILLGNVETAAQLAVLLRLGPHRFAATGEPAEPGTTLLTVGGSATRPGVVEVPTGTPLGIVLAAAGVTDPQAVIVGGYHGSWLERPHPTLRLSRHGVADAGGTFGAGVVLPLDAGTCALGELQRVAHWLAAQSAGQCGPCRFGLPALAADVTALAAGDPAAHARAAGRAADVTGRGACAHPDGAARFVMTGLAALRTELDVHRAHGGCGRPVRGVLPIGDPR